MRAGRHRRSPSDEVAAFIAELNQAFPALDLDARPTSRWSIAASCRRPSRSDGRVALEGHEQVRDHAADGVEGLVSVAGTKYTTARAVAERVIDRAAAKLQRGAGAVPDGDDAAAGRQRARRRRWRSPRRGASTTRGCRATRSRIWSPPTDRAIATCWSSRPAVPDWRTRVAAGLAGHRRGAGLGGAQGDGGRRWPTPSIRRTPLGALGLSGRRGGRARRGDRRRGAGLVRRAAARRDRGGEGGSTRVRSAKRHWKLYLRVSRYGLKPTDVDTRLLTARERVEHVGEAGGEPDRRIDRRQPEEDAGVEPDRTAACSGRRASADRGSRCREMARRSASTRGRSARRRAPPAASSPARTRRRRSARRSAESPARRVGQDADAEIADDANRLDGLGAEQRREESRSCRGRGRSRSRRSAASSRSGRRTPAGRRFPTSSRIFVATTMSSTSCVRVAGRGQQRRQRRRRIATRDGQADRRARRRSAARRSS